MKRIYATFAVVAMLMGVLAVPAAAAPASHEPISGTMAGGVVALPDPDVTPSGILHFPHTGGLAVSEWVGDPGVDLVGSIMWRYHATTWMDAVGTRIVASGAVDGEMTWNDRTGYVSGRFALNCKPDDAAVRLCDGNLVLHGDGELDGVKFHVFWGPAPWFPFQFEGVVVDSHK
jgi:hypothetical protein